MKITSPAFSNNQTLPAKYSCDGEGINPPLGFSEIPINTKSLALICDDPDAPSGSFCHWLLWNINPQETQIAATQGINSGEKPGYYPPCPPQGVHRYIFSLYALDIELDLPSSADKSQLEQTIQNHILEQVELTGLYRQES